MGIIFPIIVAFLLASLLGAWAVIFLFLLGWGGLVWAMTDIPILYVMFWTVIAFATVIYLPGITMAIGMLLSYLWTCTLICIGIWITWHLFALTPLYEGVFSTAESLGVASIFPPPPSARISPAPVVVRRSVSTAPVLPAPASMGPSEGREATPCRREITSVRNLGNQVSSAEKVIDLDPSSNTPAFLDNRDHFLVTVDCNGYKTGKVFRMTTVPTIGPLAIPAMLAHFTDE